MLLNERARRRKDEDLSFGTAKHFRGEKGRDNGLPETRRKDDQEILVETDAGEVDLEREGPNDPGSYQRMNDVPILDLPCSGSSGRVGAPSGRLGRDRSHAPGELVEKSLRRHGRILRPTQRSARLSRFARPREPEKAALSGTL